MALKSEDHSETQSESRCLLIQLQTHPINQVCVVENFPPVGLFGPVGHEVLRALTFERASNTACTNSSSCSFCSNIPRIQTWEVGKSALPRWRTTVLSGEVIWRILGKIQRGLIPVGSIFPSGGMEASSTPWISSACHFFLSLGSGRASITTLASFFWAAVHSVTESLTRPTKALSNPAD